MNLSKFYEAITGGNLWAKSGKCRIYAKTQRHIKLFLDFEDGEIENGAKIGCWVDSCGQHQNWVASQKAAAEKSGRAMFVRYIAARAFADAKPVGYDFTESDVEKICNLLDEFESLPVIAETDDAMHAIEAKASALAA